MEEFVKEDIEQTMEDLNSDEELLIYYDKDKHDRALKNSELSEALEKGIKQGKIEIVRNMINKNIDKDIISEVTGLTLEEIDSLS